MPGSDFASLEPRSGRRPASRPTVPEGGAPLQADTSQPDALLEDAKRLTEMPNFHQAVREYTIRAARFRQGPRLVNKLISYDKRWRIVGYLLYLALDHERFGPSGGATYGRLLDLCTQHLQISPRILKTVLALLRVSGFVKLIPSNEDRRRIFYEPTARLYTFVDDWLHYAVNTLDILEPEKQRAQMMRDDPSFVRRFFVYAGRAGLEDEPIVNRMPEYIAFFGRRDGATAVLLAVVLADMDETDLPSRTEIAARFSLSKTQVNAILTKAEATGFLCSKGGTPRPTPHLLDSHRRWIAIELAFYARHMQPIQ